MLIRAGIEPNPGPNTYHCASCKKNLGAYSVKCTKCEGWLHIKCSRLKNSSERKKFPNWTGPCCSPIPSFHPSKNSPNPSSRSTPPPPPPPQPPQPTTNIQQADINILQLNLNGIGNKLEELKNFLKKHNIHIAALQETKLTTNSKEPEIEDYTLIRKDRGNNIRGGGLAFFVHNTIPFFKNQSPPNLKKDPHLEELTITIPGQSSSLQIRNVYLPPSSSCSQNYNPSLRLLNEDLSDTALILGDFNAHHANWHSEANEDTRGRNLNDIINQLPIGILNEDQPTRIFNNSSTAPDISMATNNLLPTSNWKIEHALSSDHLPIIISINTSTKKIKAPKRTFVNFAKADWTKFTEYTEEEFEKSNLTSNVLKSEKIFRNIMNKAAGRHIPAGRIPKINGSNIPQEASELIETRNTIRATNPSDPRIQELNIEINEKIADHKRQKWKENVEECSQNSKKLWNTIKKLNGNPPRPNNLGIYFNNKVINDPKKLANKFNTQFTPATSVKSTKAFRRTLRKVHRKTKDDKIIITEEQTRNAIRKSKNSKAMGPDNISPIMLKHLGPNGIRFLTNIYNNSLSQTIIPSAWKIARIIPLLKPKKDISQGDSYRPISLLSPAAKIFEKILEPKIAESIPLANHQHGFRKGRSTATALQEVSNHITTGLNQNKPVERTVLVAIDLSKAFDTVNHEILLNDIMELEMNHHLKRFLFAYLRGRQTYVEFRGKKSKHRKMRQGVPQGGVLSPLLFNLYMRKMPCPPDGVKTTTYADDTNIYSSDVKIQPICDRLNPYLSELVDWFKGRNLQISAPKSSATLFTTFNNELSINLPIKINDEYIPTTTKPKILGVTYDSLFSFKHHVLNIREKMDKKNNILKALAGSNWGQQKETIVSTYRAIGQSLTNYCSPIYTPNLKPTNWTHLQTSQNTALRIATGCTKKTAIEHLHTETKLMPVKEHNHMLTKQFLLATQKPEHPNHQSTNLNQPPPPRITTNTIITEFGEDVRQKTHNQPINEEQYKRKLKEIHREEVQKVINNSSNKVLRSRPPGINEEEKLLPRSTRCTLAQLRSGYSPKLQSYLFSINASNSDQCPECLQSSHTTEHLSNCPAKPTQRTVRSLWTNPRYAAEFLGLQLQDPG